MEKYEEVERSISKKFRKTIWSKFISAVKEYELIKEGDKVVFVEEDDRVFIANASLVALKRMEKVMEGKAEKAGIKNEDDVVALVKEVRKELWEKSSAPLCQDTDL